MHFVSALDVCAFMKHVWNLPLMEDSAWNAMMHLKCTTEYYSISTWDGHI